MKENIYILVEKEKDVVTDKFENEILLTGNVYFYYDNKYVLINCKNEEIINPCKYYCLLLSGK